MPLLSPNSTYVQNAQYNLTRKEIREYEPIVKYAMLMNMPDSEDKVLFHVFSDGLMEMSPAHNRIINPEFQLDYVEEIGSLIGTRYFARYQFSGKTKLAEYQRLIAAHFYLPILVELDKTEEFTFYHLFGFDAAPVSVLREFAKANFKLYRIQNTQIRGIFGLPGRILRVDLADLTFRTLLGETYSAKEIMGGS